jgi:tetratricopeptide (TPR) repeat protein
VKIIKRLASWGETSAKFWAAYWLLILGGILIVGSALLKWVEYPFSSNLSGLEIPFFNNPGLIPRITLFSFGALGIIAFIAGVALLRFSVSVLSLAAAFLLMLCTLVPAHIAFQRPMMLRRLADELQATPLIKLFTRDYLPINYGPAEPLPRELVLDTARGRLSAAFSFLRIGWYCFTLGSLLVAVYAMRRSSHTKISTGLMLVCLPAGALVIVLTPPIIGQHYFSRGWIAKARGHNQEAIADYRKAMKWDTWHAQDINLYGIIGELQKQSGIDSNSPEQHVSRALELETTNQYDLAIFELSGAVKAGGAIAAAARRESAKTRIALGLALYHAGGVGGAVTSWQLALADDPTQVYALSYLARGYFDLGRYDSALQTIKRLIEITAEHGSTLANAYSLAGDCYAKLGRNTDARHYYRLSLTTDPIENYWALTGMVGE